VEHIITGTALDRSISRWVAGLDHRLHRKLVNAGLADPREQDHEETGTSLDLRTFLKDYIARRTDLKDTSRTVYRNVERNLIDCFGGDFLLSQLTPGHGDEFARFLKREGLDLPPRDGTTP